jgi:ketosteroid isomerase-like protein
LRSTFVLLLAFLVLSGCTTATQPAAAGSNPQRVRAIYDSFARGDVPAVLGSLDPEIVWYEAENIAYADRNPYRGPQSVLEGIFMRIGRDWNDYRLSIGEIIDGGDTVVTLGRYNATNKTTGKPLDAQFVHVWKFRDGKIVGFQQYADTAQFARVMGEWK